MVEKIYGKGEFWAWNESECVMEGERPKYQLLIYTILDIQCSINVCTAGAADNSDNSNSLNTCSLLRRRRCRISTAAPILRSLCHDMCGCVCECVCVWVCYHDKTKIPDRNNLILDTTTLGTVSKPNWAQNVKSHGHRIIISKFDTCCHILNETDYYLSRKLHL